MVRGRRTPAAGRVRVWRAAGGPEILDRVEDLPGSLNLLVVGEERRITEEDIQDQTLISLRGRLGERLAVREVHRDVAHLQRRARNLGAEAYGHAFVGLDADDQRVLAEFLRGGGGEGQVRCSLEDDGDLGDSPSEPLARPEIEGDARPPSGVNVELHGGVR